MARRKNGEDGESAPRPGSNGFDPEKVKSFVGRVENLHKDLDSERGSYMNTCKGIRGDIKSVFDEAKEAGIPKKELKRNIDRRKLEQKVEALRDDLEPEEQETYDMIAHALGDLADLPLGQKPLSEAPDAPQPEA